MVNHISDVDLANENPANLDGEHFLITVPAPDAIEALEIKNEEKKAVV